MDSVHYQLRTIGKVCCCWMASLVRLACAVVSASTFHGTNMVRAIGCAPRRYLHWSQVFLNKDRGGHSHDNYKKLVLPEEEWRNRLAPEQYYVCRQKGTEPPFSGKFNHNPKTGIYTCACCGAPLFSSKTKYDSGSGWPSFYDVLREGDNPDSNVVTKEDRSHGMMRVEVLCKKCDCHLGHVFDDGPAPTRQRYCINSASLDFIPNKPDS